MKFAYVQNIGCDQCQICWELGMNSKHNTTSSEESIEEKGWVNKISNPQPHLEALR